MAQKVLVTGSTGFIGKYVTCGLADLGLDLNVISRKNCALFNKYKNISTSNISINDRKGLSDLLKYFKPDTIIHLAAIASPTHGNISEIYEVNVYGTEILLDAVMDFCPEGTRVVLTSTAGVYGNSKLEQIPEDAPYSPVNHYSFSKMSMEMLARCYDDFLDVRIVRPFNIIGVGQKQNFLIPKLVQAFIHKEPIIKCGNLNTVRDYSDVVFASKSLIEIAMTKSNNRKVFNVCSGIGTSGTKMVDYLKEITGFNPTIEVDDAFVRRKEIDRLVGNPRNLNDFLGNKAVNLPVKEILINMLESYR